MTKLGMNADVIVSLAGKLDQQASAISAVIAQVESLVNRAVGEWQGPDAQQFTGWWHNQHKPALQRAHDSVAGLAQSARNNASEQTTVSNGPGGHTVPTPGVGVPHSAPKVDGPVGTQNYSAQRSIDLARDEVGSSRPTGWDQPGECIKSVQRWVNEAGGHFGGGGVVSGYTNSGAVPVDLSGVHAGDVLQLTSQTNSDTDWAHVHTVLIAGVNKDGTYDIIQSNSPEGSGLVTEVKNWSPTSNYPGWEWRAWRFAADQ